MALSPAQMIALIDEQIEARVRGEVVSAGDEARRIEYLGLDDLKNLRAHYDTLDKAARANPSGGLTFAKATNGEPS